MIGQRPIEFVTSRAARARPLVLAALLVPLALYPLCFGLFMLYDTVAGDMLIRYHLLFESRRRVLLLFLADWLHALPFSYLVVLGTLVPLFIVTSTLHRWRHTSFITAGATLAMVPATFLRGELPGPLMATIFAAGGAILAAAFAQIVARPRQP